MIFWKRKGFKIHTSKNLYHIINKVYEHLILYYLHFSDVIKGIENLDKVPQNIKKTREFHGIRSRDNYTRRVLAKIPKPI